MSLLWFRRSRKNDAKQEPEAPTHAPVLSHQPRPPLRIRGLLLLNLHPEDGIAEIETAPPLGSRSHVIDTVRSALAGIQFSDSRGELSAEHHRVTIDLGADDPVRAIVAAAEGEDGIEMLGALLEQTGWRAYAPKAGVFVQPDALDLFALPDGNSS